MREIILKLLKQYHNLRMVSVETITSGEGKEQRTVTFPTRTSISFKIVNDRGEYDDKKTEVFIDNEKYAIALEIYEMTIDILKTKNKEWKNIDDRRNIKTHQQLISWSRRQLIEMDIISPHDYVLQEETQDEEGDIIGYTRLPNG